MCGDSMLCKLTGKHVLLSWEPVAVQDGRNRGAFLKPGQPRCTGIDYAGCPVNTSGWRFCPYLQQKLRQ